MRGYLGHIAAKVSGTRPVVRPKVPSLFEPLPGAGFVRIAGSVRQDRGGHIEREVELVSSEVESERRVTTGVQGEPSTDAPASYTRSTNERSQELAVPPASSASQPLQRAFEPVALPATQRMPSPEKQFPEGPAKLQPAEPFSLFRPKIRPAMPPVEATEETQEQARPVEVHVAHVAAAPETAQHILPKVDRIRNDGEGSRPAPDRLRSLAELTKPIPAANFSNHSPGTPMAQPSTAQKAVFALDRTKEEVPSVQVTIGRVIVEAILPPSAPVPAPVRHAQAGPRLSLDEYLRQRGARA